MANFLGFVQLESSLLIAALVKSGGAPINGDSLPVFRIYGAGGLMSGGTGTLAKTDTGNITGATNASPIVITSSSHGLSTGAVVTVAGVGVNTAANGTFVVTKIDSNTFSLNGSTGNGVYTSGGSWNTTGLYSTSFTASGANGFVSGSTYAVLVTAAVSATPWADLLTFTVT